MFVHYQTDPYVTVFPTNWIVSSATAALSTGITTPISLSPRTGSYMASFNGASTTSVVYTNNIPVDFSSQYTIEFWICPFTDIFPPPSSRKILGVGGSTNPLTLNIQYGTNTTTITLNGIVTSAPISKNTWTHIAFVKYSNSSRKVFVNGVGGTTSVASFNDNPNTTSGNALTLGTNVNTAGNLYGCLDLLRISNVARYSSNFSPPTTLTMDTNTWYLSDFENTWQPELPAF